jgi:hypothetical protein
MVTHRAVQNELGISYLSGVQLCSAALPSPLARWPPEFVESWLGDAPGEALACPPR